MAVVAGLASALIQAGAVGFMGWLFGGAGGLVVGLVAGCVIGAPYGWSLAVTSAYPPGARGLLLFAVDHSWSLLNTLTGAVFLLGNLLAGHSLDRAAGRHRARVNVVEPAIPGYATTVGNVVAGMTAQVEEHEQLHIWQARLFGPAYLPMVVGNYVLFLLVPVWLIYHDHARFPVTGPIRYLKRGVYPHLWHETWAYRREGITHSRPRRRRHSEDDDVADVRPRRHLHGRRDAG